MSMWCSTTELQMYIGQNICSSPEEFLYPAFVDLTGFEPATFNLQSCCSATELQAPMWTCREANPSAKNSLYLCYTSLICAEASEITPLILEKNEKPRRFFPTITLSWLSPTRTQQGSSCRCQSIMRTKNSFRLIEEFRVP